MLVPVFNNDVIFTLHNHPWNIRERLLAQSLGSVLISLRENDSDNEIIKKLCDSNQMLDCMNSVMNSDIIPKSHYLFQLWYFFRVKCTNLKITKEEITAMTLQYFPTHDGKVYARDFRLSVAPFLMAFFQRVLMLDDACSLPLNFQLILESLQDPEFTRPISDVLLSSSIQTDELGHNFSFLLLTLPEDFKLFIQFLEFECRHFSYVYYQDVWAQFRNMNFSKLDHPLTLFKPQEKPPVINLSYFFYQTRFNKNPPISCEPLMLENKSKTLIISNYEEIKEDVLKKYLEKLEGFSTSFEYAFWMFQLDNEGMKPNKVNYIVATTELDMSGLSSFSYPSTYPGEGKISLLTKDLLTVVIQYLSDDSLFPYRFISKKWNSAIKSLLHFSQLIIARPRLSTHTFYLYNPKKLQNSFPKSLKFRQLITSRVSTHYYEPGDVLIILNRRSMQILISDNNYIDYYYNVSRASVMKHVRKYEPLGENTEEELVEIARLGLESNSNNWQEYDDSIHFAVIRL